MNIGDTIVVRQKQIIDKYAFGDVFKLQFKLENDEMVYIGDVISLSSHGNYTVIITDDSRNSIEKLGV